MMTSTFDIGEIECNFRITEVILLKVNKFVTVALWELPRSAY